MSNKKIDNSIYNRSKPLNAENVLLKCFIDFFGDYIYFKKTFVSVCVCNFIISAIMLVSLKFDTLSTGGLIMVSTFLFLSLAFGFFLVNLKKIIKNVALKMLGASNKQEIYALTLTGIQQVDIIGLLVSSTKEIIFLCEFIETNGNKNKKHSFCKDELFFNKSDALDSYHTVKERRIKTYRKILKSSNYEEAKNFFESEEYKKIANHLFFSNCNNGIYYLDRLNSINYITREEDLMNFLEIVILNRSNSKKELTDIKS